MFIPAKFQYLVHFHVIRELLAVLVVGVVFRVPVFLVVLLLDAENVAQVGSGELPFFLLCLKI